MGLEPDRSVLLFFQRYLERRRVRRLILELDKAAGADRPLLRARAARAWR
jgi:hypothetical protein